MTTELQAHSKALEEHTTNTARDVAILKDKDQEYARQGQAKSKEVTPLDSAPSMQKYTLFYVTGRLSGAAWCRVNTMLYTMLYTMLSGQTNVNS